MTGRPALRCGAVVTTDARRAQAGVIDPGARKGQRTLVTSLARGIRDDVFRRLAEGDRAAMTSGAIRDEPRMVHTGSSERYGTLVATLAGGTGDDVVCPLAGRGRAVVAGRATRDETRLGRLRRAVDHACLCFGPPQL